MSSGGDLWRTLGFLYSAVLVVAICVPVATIVPLFFGVGGFLPLVCSGCLGLVLSAGGVFSLVGRYGTHADRVESEGRGNHADDSAEEATPDGSR